MSHRFFLEHEISEGTAVLDGDQAHHAIEVMRFSVGDFITVFDGKGNEHRASILELGKKRLRLKIESTLRSTAEPTQLITIAVTLPKGERQRFLIEKLVELGVQRMIPLKTERSVAVANAKVIERLRKGVVEACKQCGRNQLMEIEHEQSVSALIAQNLNSTESPVACLLADPKAKVDLAPALPSSARQRIIAIGPEGGFTFNETEQFKAANWVPVSLGPTILRIETAALKAAVLLAQ